MPILTFPTPAAAPALRRRKAQQQQQPDRIWLNRQQQQQGYSEYQQGQVAPATGRDPQAAATAGRNAYSTPYTRSTT